MNTDIETFDNAYPNRDYTIRHVATEYPSLCPKTGNPDFGTMPDFIATDPKEVVRVTLNGARRGRMHNFPCFFSKAAWYFLRFTPWITFKQKLMKDSIIEADMR